MYKPIDELIALVRNLRESTMPKWGKMSPQEMVEHLIYVFRVSNGKLESKLFSDESKLHVLKKVLMSDRLMPKNFNSPANQQVPDEYQFDNLETAKIELLKEVIEYYNYFDMNPESKPMNPTFGELNKEEWDQFHRKHLTHHLTQFGLIE